MSILRQELDSLVRVIFLLSQSERTYRSTLIADSVEGRQWTKKGGKGRITDRELVDLSKTFSIGRRMSTNLGALSFTSQASTTTRHVIR